MRTRDTTDAAPTDRRCCASPCPTRARCPSRARDAARGRLPPARRHRELRARPTPTTASSSSTCARATSRCTSARARSTSASPAATCCSTPAPRRRGARARVRRLPLPVRRPRRAPSRDARRTWPACGSPRRTPASCAATSRSAASTPRVDPARRRGRDRDPARGRRRDRRRGRDRQHAARRPGWRSSATRSCESEAVLVRRAGAASPDGLRGLPAPARGRPGGAQLRDDGLRHRRSTGSSRPSALTPGIESPTVSPAAPRRAGSRCGRWCRRAGAHRSWTSSTTSVRAGSWSPTSTPAGSEPGACRSHTPGVRSASGSPP